MASAAIQSYKIKAAGLSQQGEVDKLGGSGEDIRPSIAEEFLALGGTGTRASCRETSTIAAPLPRDVPGMMEPNTGEGRLPG